MKKLIFIAILASLCLWLGCNKAEQEPVPVTPTEVSDTNTDVSNGNPNGEVTSRANCQVGSLFCPSCTCCCGLTLISPTGTDIDINICGAVIGCFSGGTSGCMYGGGCGSSATSGNGGDTFLNTSSGSGDTKIFCSGGVNDVFEVTNIDNVAATFTIECGGASSNQFTLQPGEIAYIRKGTNCDIDPDDPCIY